MKPILCAVVCQVMGNSAEKKTKNETKQTNRKKLDIMLLP